MEFQNKPDLLEIARALVTALETDDDKEAELLLVELTQTQESDLFHEVGKLTRELHDSLSNFNVDPRLVDLTKNDIPDTRERLNYVITTTEEAAHKTLGLIDKTLPLSNSLKLTADNIEQSWHRFRMREMDVNEFRTMSDEIESYLPNVKLHADKIHENLSEMTLAQGFQDLTGQVIRQVIELVEEVQNNLVDLVKIAGKHQQSSQKDGKKAVDPIKAEGPQINKDKPNVVNNQDEVDDLLSSLGF
jgi:chemotaxis protein CheZ